MSKRNKRKQADPPSDPRKYPGDIIGDGGPHTRFGVTIDARHAVLLDYIEVCGVESGAPAGTVALLMAGKVNNSTDRAKILFMTGMGGVAQLIGECTALYGRAGLGNEFVAIIDTLLTEMGKADLLKAKDGTDENA